MSNLSRDPDPTLYALGDTAVGLTYPSDDAKPPIAHRWQGLITHRRGGVALRGRDAAYIAVPCRECFPEAPPPGMDLPFQAARGWIAKDSLAWQVPS